MKCWHCQTDLIWGSDKKIEDDHVIGNDEFSTVTDLSCPACNGVEITKLAQTIPLLIQMNIAWSRIYLAPLAMRMSKFICQRN